MFENVLIAKHCRRSANLLSAAFRLNADEEKRQREECENLLHVLGLEDVRNELATGLPYGLQRRVEIARALATEPKLLLLDEPAAGMNPQAVSYTHLGQVRPAPFREPQPGAGGLMRLADTRPPFAGLANLSWETLASLPTPCYLLDEGQLRRNGELLLGVQQRTGCKILLAQKAFSNFNVYPVLAPYLAGTEASGLYEMCIRDRASALTCAPS